MFKKYIIGTISSRGYMKGIYKITINNKIYIGKDSRIDLNKRFRAHLLLLEKGKHYNTYMQNSYNKNNNLTYDVLEVGTFTDKELSDLEKEYILGYDSFNSGFNLTLGGDGGSGHIKSEELKDSISKRYIQDKNPMSKINYSDFLKIVEMLKNNCTNSEIGEKFSIHSRYVSLIRHKKRYSNWWDTIEYIENNSPGRSKKISYEIFVDILENKNLSRREISKFYNVDYSCVTRILNEKSHKEYFNKYNRVQRPTNSSELNSEELSSVGPSGGLKSLKSKQESL